MADTVSFDKTKTRAQALASTVKGRLFFPTDTKSIILDGKEYVANTIIEFSADPSKPASWVGLDFSSVYNNTTWVFYETIYIRWSSMFIPCTVNKQGNYIMQFAFITYNGNMVNVTATLNTSTKIVSAATVKQYTPSYATIT